MTQASSFYIRRLQRNVAKREKRILRLERKVEAVTAKYQAGKITRAKLQSKLQELESKLRVVKARLQTYRGAIGKERRKIDTGETG